MPSKLIAHAGGGIHGTRYTNSREAILLSAQATDLIELDLVPTQDGLVMAHSNFEKKYGLDRKFWNISTAEFLQTKFDGRFTPLSFSELSTLSKTLSCKFVLDTKPRDAAYAKCIETAADICERDGTFGNFIIQVYCPDDLQAVARHPFHGIMVTYWKRYHNIFSADARRFLLACQTTDRFSFIAASVEFKRINKDDQIRCAEDLTHLAGTQIYIHGQPTEPEPKLLELGYGLFTHSPARQ